METGVTVERGKQGPLQPLRCFLLKFPYAHGTRTYKLVWKIIVINFVEIERTKQEPEMGYKDGFQTLQIKELWKI